MYLIPLQCKNKFPNSTKNENYSSQRNHDIFLFVIFFFSAAATRDYLSSRDQGADQKGGGRQKGCCYGKDLIIV